MDDQVQQKLSEFYDPAKAERVMLSLLPEYMVSLCNEDTQHHGGLLLFDGLVKLHCGYNTILADEHMTISGSHVGEIKSLFIKPLKRRIREEYVRMENIKEIKMTGMFRTQHRTPLSFAIDFASGNRVSLEMWLINGMLYVPKKSKPESRDLSRAYQNPMPDPLDNLY